MPPKLRRYESHPLADLFPMMGADEFKELADDIEHNGLFDKIWLFEDKILDGRNREKACHEREVDPKYEEYRGKDPVGFVIAKNLHRRHLSESQRALVAAKLVTAKKGGQPAAGESANSPIQPTTTKQAAKRLNVSESSVKAAAKVKTKGAAELVKEVEKGTVTVAAAAKVAELPEADQKKLVAAGPAEVKKAAAEARAADKPIVQSRPMPHETRTGKGKQKAAGLGGEKFGFAVIERTFGAIVRGVEQMADHFEVKNGRSHTTAIGMLDDVLKYVTTWHNRELKKETE